MARGLCDCITVNPRCVTATSATSAAGTTTLTITQLLTGLTGFRLNVPCALISGLPNSDIVEITDGTNTYPMLNWLGNNLELGTLKRYFCSNCDCNCNRTLIAFVGNDPTHVSILSRVM